MRKVIIAIVILVSAAALAVDGYLLFGIIQNKKTVSEEAVKMAEAGEATEASSEEPAKEQAAEEEIPEEPVQPEETADPVDGTTDEEEGSIQNLADYEAEKDFSGPYDCISFPPENVTVFLKNC